MNEILVKEFEKTRSRKEYNDSLETVIYTESMLSNLNKTVLVQESIHVDVRNTDTVSEIISSSGYTAALNFADGYIPGGLVLSGAKTQEEALCRSSNLYESLILDECIKEYYEYNKNNKEFSNGKSSDRIIYTRNVTFFRDSSLNWLSENEIKHCDIITCPAPIIETAKDNEIMNRMKNIIKVADHNRVTTLILGCWGCGAFGNDWDHFSKLWMNIINNINTNCNIVFAIREKEFNPRLIRLIQNRNLSITIKKG